MGKRITIDAHALIWYIYAQSNSMLTKKALNTINEAMDNGIIHVPTIILLEILRLIEKGKYPISFDKLIDNMKRNDAFDIVPLTIEIIELSEKLNHWDIHDRAIIATAIYTNTDLVSADEDIAKIYNRVIW
jgi:PIN domain nuclease of toxin-antitoxin system